MRGTCSAGFALRATGGSRAGAAGALRDKSTPQTMMPVAHLSWAPCGRIAAGAVERARAFIRNAARSSGGQMPPGAAHFTRATLRCARCAA